MCECPHCRKEALKVKTCPTQSWGGAGTGARLGLGRVPDLAGSTSPPAGRREKCSVMSPWSSIGNRAFKSPGCVHFVQRDGQPGSKQCLEEAGAFPRITKRKRSATQNERVKHGHRGDLMAGFSDVCDHSHRRSIILKRQIWVQHVQSGSWDSECLAGSQVTQCC